VLGVAVADTAMERRDGRSPPRRDVRGMLERPSEFKLVVYEFERDELV
jgi:hypothetical protein